MLTRSSIEAVHVEARAADEVGVVAGGVAHDASGGAPARPRPALRAHDLAHVALDVPSQAGAQVVHDGADAIGDEVGRAGGQPAQEPCRRRAGQGT